MQTIRKLQEAADTPRRATKLVSVSRTLNAAEALELQRLFDLIADTCDAASVVLNTGSDLERLRGLAGSVDAMVGRTKSILG
jgi:hypothetical protein